MAEEDVFLTRQGYEEFRKEYEMLKATRRRELAKAIEKARALGDLRENAEYSAAKEAQALNEKKIAELEYILSRTRILDTENIDKDKVFLGTKIRLKNLDDGQVEEYALVSEAEADFNKNKISVTSLIGKALLGHKKKDMVQIKVPAGITKYEILDITR